MQLYFSSKLKVYAIKVAVLSKYIFVMPEYFHNQLHRKMMGVMLQFSSLILCFTDI